VQQLDVSAALLGGDIFAGDRANRSAVEVGHAFEVQQDLPPTAADQRVHQIEECVDAVLENKSS
jgi:hypothetical protein